MLKRPLKRLAIVLALGVFALAARAASVTPDLQSGWTVGATVTFTVSGNGAGPELYRLVVRRADSEIRALYNFRADNAFA